MVRLPFFMNPPVDNDSRPPAPKSGLPPLAQPEDQISRAIGLLEDIAGHHFSVDGTPQNLRTRYDEATTARMVSYLRFLFTGEPEASTEAAGLGEHNVTFVRMVFALFCKTEELTGLKAQQTSWYTPTVVGGLCFNSKKEVYLLQNSYLQVVQPRLADTAIGHIRQADLALKLLPNGLLELSRCAGVALIAAFLTVVPNPERTTRLSLAAAHVQRVILAKEYAENPEAVRAGIDAGRKGLQEAYAQLRKAAVLQAAAQPTDTVASEVSDLVVSDTQSA